MAPVAGVRPPPQDGASPACDEQAELGEWYQLLAVLDAQRQSELSLVMLLVWSHEPMQRLLTMTQLARPRGGNRRPRPLCVAWAPLVTPRPVAACRWLPTAVCRG